ncbi:hypothetical protein SAMN04488033_12548 [Salegentibacter agarivorans]|uniref:Transposase n=1 Tax=Salegentibacter agarivorans TaxID=345907 RepID=A0A1I2NW95_9FLAO|nr:hypothetical protein SAMN04488033_12548 [Salegentibacter agarivorans]
MDKQAYMFELIQEWKASGLSKKDFCHNHGILRSNFYYWFKKNGRTANRKLRMDL